MANPGDDVSNDGLWDVTEFTMSIQVYLGKYDRVKVAEASARISKAYIDELTSTGLEG